MLPGDGLCLKDGEVSLVDERNPTFPHHLRIVQVKMTTFDIKSQHFQKFRSISFVRENNYNKL